MQPRRLKRRLNQTWQRTRQTLSRGARWVWTHRPGYEPPISIEHARKLWKQPRCVQCGGWHQIACPRVKRLRFTPNGEKPSEVEFWPSGQWDQAHIVWPKDMPIPSPEET